MSRPAMIRPNTKMTRSIMVRPNMKLIRSVMVWPNAKMARSIIARPKHHGNQVPKVDHFPQLAISSKGRTR